MLHVDPKALIKRLTPSATRALEAAVGRALQGQYYEVLPEHLLLTLLEADVGEAAFVCERAKIDRGALLVRVERSLGFVRTGHSARPVLARSLFDWLESAWLFASVELSEPVLRSGVLLAVFAAEASTLASESFPELDPLRPLSAAKRALIEWLPLAPESAEAPTPSGVGTLPGKPQPGDDEALKRYTRSFVEEARAGKSDPAFGRHREIRQLIDILSRRRKNNPIIVGEPGVGKTALVEGLAHAIVAKEVPPELADVDIRSLDLAALQAGAGVRGEFEQRLKAVLGAVKAAAKPIVLFIDEAHTLIGAGGPQGGGDAANLLKPELARGELRTIAATTWSEYKKYFEKDAALERRFQPVKVDEPSEDVAIAMLRGLRESYERAHGTPIRDEALVAAVRLSRRYISGRQLPDKAVDLLDSAAARAKIELSARPEALRELEEEAAGLERALTAQKRDRAQGVGVDPRAIRDLEARRDELSARREAVHAAWQEERELVIRLLEAQRHAHAGAAADGRPEVAQLKAELAAKRAGREPLVHAEADAVAVARVVQSWTGIPVGKMRADALEAVLQLEQRLGARVRGQTHALTTVAETLRMAKAGVGQPDAPLGVLLFVGPSGVGKTETALALADSLYGGDRFLTTVNMSEYQEKHSVSRLVGSPPGYVGYGEGGVLTEAVRQRPYCVVLLDECEKADLEVMNLFYQVFDKGTLSDGEGRTIDFRNTIIILTSNLASDTIMSLYAHGTPSVDEVVARIRPQLSAHFKPALLARMTIVPYAPMQPGVLREIASAKLSKVAARLANAHGVKLDVDPTVLDRVVALCESTESGARNVDHVLRAHVLSELSRVVLTYLVDDRAPPLLKLNLTPDLKFAVEPQLGAAPP